MFKRKKVCLNLIEQDYTKLKELSKQNYCSASCTVSQLIKEKIQKEEKTKCI